MSDHFNSPRRARYRRSGETSQNQTVLEMIRFSDEEANLLITAPLQQGESVELEVSLDSGAATKMSHARVLWTEPNVDGNWIVGLSLT